jgi:hypothetical protein
MQQSLAARFAYSWLILSSGLVSGGCGSVYCGTYPDGLSAFPNRPITPAKAVEAAEPYFDQTFALCRAARGSNWPDSKPRIRVMLDGHDYRVLKDNYPSMNANYGFKHAVIINAETGEVTPPK